MKVYLRRNQTLIKKKKKKTPNSYNSRGKVGEAQWLAHGGIDETVLPRWVTEEMGIIVGWHVAERNQLRRLDLDLKN